MDTKIDNDLVNELNFEGVLLNSLPNPVYYKDDQGRFIECNTSFLNLVNKQKEEVIGKLAYKFFPKNVANRHKLIDKNIMKTFESYMDKIIFPLVDGSIKYFTLNKAVYLKKDGTVGGIVCVMNDITAQTQEKDILIQQSKFAEMGEMIASIAHQWNEPLVSLSAFVQQMEFLYSVNKMDNDKMSDLANSSMVQIQYMSNTLSDFRNFLKPSTVKKKFGIKKAIKEIFEIIGKQIFYFNISVEYEYENNEKEIYIYTYKNQLKQVLLNIINNAKNKIVQLGDEIDFKAVISIKFFTNNKYSVIEITDNAGAMDEKVKKHLFEPFFTTYKKGTGFGLYMAKVIIEDKMLGKIEARNNENNVTFSIKIPHKKVIKT